MKFKTLCARCNSHLLGQLYDVELLKFVDGFQHHLRGITPTTPVAPIVHVRANLHAVARSVIGHLLAAHSIQDTQQFRENIGASESLRQYFLDPEAPFPDDWRLLCWPYFHERQVILRHTVWKDIASDHAGTYGHLLKFSPFAFWLINDAPENLHIGGQDITPAGNDNTQLSSVYFPMFRVPNALYPELPTNNTFLFNSGNQSSIARPYRNPNYTKKSPGKSKP
ncbi:hypothetical protein [Flavobacterium sp.]|uniref:hypothetical protein n=1 Tax=Flavobacterium sp. TaxID=239 RepID=UPI0026082C2E|nr:hypothetical protein [Flavobacterium sp.]